MTRDARDESGVTATESTRTLLDRYRRGDGSALNLLISREIPRLQRWARGRLPSWVRSLVDTADLVQEALTRTLPHLSRFEPRRQRALQAYLRMVVANQIRDELKRASRHHLLDEAQDAVPSREPSPLDSLLEDEDRLRLARGLARLSDGDRMAVIARLHLGYSYEQIALILGRRSPNAARMAVTRAVNRLIEHMSDEGGEPK